MANVLVIEDNPANMKLACLLLRHAQHTVLCAVDAETGLTLARTEQPDLILMDMQLPGMDGLTATSQLKQDPLTQAIPVIALTALAMKADQEKCQAAGCDGYIAKPLRYQELFAAIDALLQLDTAPVAIPTAQTRAPLNKAQAAEIEPEFDLTSRGDGRMVLVAEDNPTNQKLILSQLALLGVAANVANNGQLAFKRWQTGQYALVLTDLQMPEMNGYALTAAIRAAENGALRIPIVALTANARAGEAEGCRLAGMDDYLSKPLRLAELKATLEVWLPGSTRALTAPAGSATSAQPLPAFDPTVLASNVGDDPALLRALLLDFQSSAGEIAGQLIAACSEGEARASANAAHKLMSAARAVGATALGDLCARIEASGNAENVEIVTSLLPQFEHEFDAVNAALDAHLAKHADDHLQT